jgi:hypothetical protein
VEPNRPNRRQGPIGRIRRAGLLAMVAGLGVVAAGGLVGCGSGPAARTDRRAAATDASDPAAPVDPADPKSYVGRTRAQATATANAAGIPWRITRVDDEWNMVTQDYVVNRLNFEIDDGVVTRATLG